MTSNRRLDQNANRPTKVLHIFNRMDAGGAEMRTLDVLRHVDRRRFQFDFCTLSSRPGSLDDQILSLGGRVHPTPLGIDFPRRFVHLLRSKAYDVVHSHTLYATGMFLRLARFAEIPIRVAHFRSTGSDKLPTVRRRFKQLWLRRWIDRHATHILAVSQTAMELAWRKDWRSDRRCQIVYNGLNTSNWLAPQVQAAIRLELNLPADALLVIHVGNLLPDKNHRRVISVFAEVLKRRTNAYLLLVGEGGNALEIELHRQIDALGLADRVILLGRRTDVPDLLRGADVMVFPSLREGLPGAVLEACATGLAVLASGLPAVREIQPYLPSLRSLAIEASNVEWAAQTLDHCAKFSDAHRRETARQAFASSPFQIAHTTETLCRVWTSQSSAVGGRFAWGAA